MDDLSIPFFMRDSIRQRIQKRVDALQKGYRQNMAVIGSEGMGKTQLLSSTYSALSHQSDCIPVYVHAQHLDYENLIERWIGGILNGFFAGKLIQSPSQKIDSLLQTANPIIPETTEKMRQLRRMVRKEKNAASVKELFSLTATLSRETQKQVVLMIDEFQDLEALPTSDPFALLGKEIMVETNTLYLVSSSRAARAHEIFHDKLSLLFGNFETIELAPLGFKEALNFLKWHLPGFIFSAEQTDFMIRLTDGHPLYLEMITDELNSKLKVGASGRIETKKLVPNNLIIDAFCRELFSRKGRIALLLEKRLDACRRLVKENGPYIKTLLALSHGCRKIPAISSFIGKRATDTKKILQRMLKEEMIVKRGAFYHLEDALFRFWLCEVFERREEAYSPHQNLIREGLQRALERELALSRELVKLDTRKRVEALFKEFRNDVVEVDSKKVQCPQFSEISSRTAGGGQVPIFAKGTKVRWLCQVLEASVHEDDILQLLEEAKRYRKKAPRKMVLALYGIEQNAKLVAQESKVQVWDLRTFNQLLDLYGLPKMILIHESKASEETPSADIMPELQK